MTSKEFKRLVATVGWQSIAHSRIEAAKLYKTEKTDIRARDAYEAAIDEMNEEELILREKLYKLQHSSRYLKREWFSFLKERYKHLQRKTQ
jgi:hypothetical protein